MGKRVEDEESERRKRVRSIITLKVDGLILDAVQSLEQVEAMTPLDDPDLDDLRSMYCDTYSVLILLSSLWTGMKTIEGGEGEVGWSGGGRAEAVRVKGTLEILGVTVRTLHNEMLEMSLDRRKKGREES